MQTAKRERVNRLIALLAMEGQSVEDKVIEEWITFMTKFEAANQKHTAQLPQEPQKSQSSPDTNAPPG